MAVEHAPPGRRAVFGSLPQMGLPAGVILANLAFIVVTQSLAPEQFAQWDWRVPFLLSATLILVGLVLRLKVAESPEFDAVREEPEVQQAPLVEVARSHGLVGVGLSAVAAERFGRKRVFMVGALAVAAWAFPFFALVDTGNDVAMWLALSVASLAVATMAGPQAALVADLFPPAVRYSGSSLAYQGRLGRGRRLRPHHRHQTVCRLRPVLADRDLHGGPGPAQLRRAALPPRAVGRGNAVLTKRTQCDWP